MLGKWNASISCILVVMIALVVSGCGGGGGDREPDAPSSDANLADLNVSDVTLSPAFATDTIDYAGDVPNSVAAVRVTATTRNNGATLTVNGISTPSGTSADVTLAVGDNNVDTIVTAADLATLRTYRVVVTRALPSSNANLASLSLSVGELDQVFDTDQPNYSASLGYLASGVHIIAPPEDANASVTVNGQAVVGATSALIDLAEGANPVLVTVTAEDLVTTKDFMVDITRESFLTFTQRVYVKPEAIDAFDVFGASVAVEGNWLAVGMPGDQSLATGINGDSADNSGASVGSVWVYKRDSGGVWTPHAYLKASNAEVGDRFGSAVTLSRDTLVVGAWGEQSAALGINGDQSNNAGSNVGAAYVFVRDGNDVWAQQAYLKASNAESNDEFGRFLRLHDDTLVVGSWLEKSAATGVGGDEQDNSLNNAGAAYVFVRDNVDTWTQQAYIKPSNIDSEDRFGANLDIEGDTLIVGSHLEDSNARGVDGDDTDNSALNSGAAYVFERDALGAWQQSAYLKASNADDGDLFGTNPKLVGDVLLVGAVHEQSLVPGVNADPTNNAGLDVGAVYEFSRDANGDWSETTYFKASNPNSQDEFGSAVAYRGNTLVVGARGEDSVDSGINGNEADNAGRRVGAAYVFIRDDGVWGQVAYVKASNPGTDDELADALDFDGDTLVVGAQGERSAATGLNGAQTDDTLPSAGAAYMFR